MNPLEIKKQFPIFHHLPNLVYLDNAATTQKPHTVIEAISHFYSYANANIHRGIYPLSENASLAYDQVRAQVAQFIHARQAREIIFVRGTTEAINLVAHTYGQTNFQAGDEIIVSTMEHHSNLLPWQLIAARTGAKIVVTPLTPKGELDLARYQQLFTPQTKMVALAHVSNVLGTINPISELCRIAHSYQVPVLVDGAQAFAHLPIDVQALDCDFYAFSAHKGYGPMGIGVLYGKEALLESLPPYQGGGGMIERVTCSQSSFAELPAKFEAGTGDVAAVMGLGAALTFLQTTGLTAIQAHEQQLLQYATTQLQALPGLRLFGTSPQRSGILSFTLAAAHPHDVASLLAAENIAVRAGHHCAMPLMDFYGIAGTTRVSLGVYNTSSDIDALTQGLERVVALFSR